MNPPTAPSGGGRPLSRPSATRGWFWVQDFARPAISLDNNATQRALRGISLGTKNQYGYSPIESAKLCGGSTPPPTCAKSRCARSATTSAPSS